MEAHKKKWFYLVFLALIWGSSFILIKRGLIGLTPLQLGSLRIIFAALFLLAIGFKTLPTIPTYKWKYLALTGLFGTFIPAFLFAIAQTQIDSSISSILNSLTPMNTLILGVLAFGLSFTRRQIFGVIIGLFGSALLILNGAMTHPNQNYYYALLILVASICYATNVNLLKKYLSDISPLAISTANFAILLLPALLLLSFSGFFEIAILPKTHHAIGFVLLLGIVGTGIANVMFFRLIQISSPVFATSVTYLIPLVAFFWGLFDQEVLSKIQLLGAAIILIGVYLSSKKSR